MPENEITPHTGQIHSSHELLEQFEELSHSELHFQHKMGLGLLYLSEFAASELAKVGLSEQAFANPVWKDLAILNLALIDASRGIPNPILHVERQGGNRIGIEELIRRSFILLGYDILVGKSPIESLLTGDKFSRNDANSIANRIQDGQKNHSIREIAKWRSNFSNHSWIDIFSYLDEIPKVDLIKFIRTLPLSEDKPDDHSEKSNLIFTYLATSRYLYGELASKAIDCNRRKVAEWVLQKANQRWRIGENGPAGPHG